MKTKLLKFEIIIEEAVFKSNTVSSTSNVSTGKACHHLGIAIAKSV